MTLKDYAALVEDALARRLEECEGPLRQYTVPGTLNQAMRYSLLAGAKRLRPAMLLAAVEMLGGDLNEALAPACAIEMIHTYSLIHDDLPGMDDDVLRRGRPTSHVVYGEGQAILAGDALLNGAYEWMLENALKYPQNLASHVMAINEIAQNAGARGMVGGQSVDLSCEKGQAPKDEATLDYVHFGKTAAMFIGAVRAGAYLAGADYKALSSITRYATAFGLMFQAADDLLDVEGEAGTLGKSIGKDAREGKLTAVSIYGIEGTRARAQALLDAGLAALEGIGANTEFFRALILSMQGRRS